MEKQLAELIARLKAIDGEQADIEKASELQNEGRFTEEQRARYEALQAEYDTKLGEKQTIEGELALKAKRAGRVASKDFEPAVNPRRSDDGSGAPVSKAGRPVESPADEPGDQRPKFRIPPTVKRGGTPKNFKGIVDGLEPEERAYRFGQWCLARISSDMPNRYNFADAKRFVQNYMSGTPQNIAASEIDGTTGSHYLVPQEFGTDLINLRERYGVARRLFKIVRMTSDTRTDPRRQGGLTAYFTSQGSAGTESNKTWDEVRLTARDLMVLARYTNQLSADAVISIGDDLAGEIAYAFAYKEDDCAFNGTGASTYGGIQGARHKLQNLDTSGTDSAGLFTQGTGSTWPAIVLADFNGVLGKLPQYADTPNACWVCHKAFYHTVMQKLELAAGGVTAMEISVGDRRPRPLFMGYPVEFSQVFPSATASAAVPCLLGDFALAASFGDRQQDAITFSEHATIGGESVFERNQIAIRGTERFDINVHDAGSSSEAGPYVGLLTG